jgi:hypothetical protein
MHAWTRAIMDYYALSKAPGHQKDFGEVSFHFQLELNTLGLFERFQRYDSKGLKSGVRGGLTSKNKVFPDIY